MAEFSAYGVAGARVDRIAKAAGCNKNLIYIYFENKETLFTTVLQKHLLGIYEQMPFTPDDLPGYAVRFFDFAMAHPDLMRLITWFGLEQRAEGLARRTASFDAKVEALVEAQGKGRVGTTFPPRFLLTAVMALAAAWTATNPFGSALDSGALEHTDALRENIARAVALLADPGAGKAK